jgi:ribosomal protein L40E
MTRRSKGFVELEWTCPNCDSRNRGSRKTCENCGAPQPENVQFQRAAEEKRITDENAARLAGAGADIHCGFCGARNPAAAKTCSQCGGDLAEGKKRQAGAALQAAPALPKTVVCKNCDTENPGSERICSKCGSPLPRAEAPRPAPAKAAASSPSAQKKQPNWWLFGGIGAFLLLCCVAIIAIFFLPTKTLQGTVTDVAWQTSVPVQEVRAVDYNNEPGGAPSGAYNVSCHTESEEVCSERTVDQGNGYAEVVEECHTESQEYCSYTVDEWTTIQTYTLDGNDLYPVYESPNVSFDQRLGDASERLTVYFNTPEGQETYTPDTISEYQQFQIGSTWTLKMNLAGAVISVE